MSLKSLNSDRKMDYDFNPIRIGVPRDFHRDLYFYFMQASWVKLFSVLFLLYIISNIVFAFAYLAVPNSISDSANISFLDAFFFSVQTISTIGYGVKYPSSLYANAIVTIEAAYGVFSVALITGLLFSKFSKPVAKIVFSKNMVLSKFNEETCLSFRIGNLRGNDIIAARISVSALVDEVTSEGEKFRRIYDLKLQRSETPFFKLTWSIFHPVDAESPITRCQIEGNNLVAITVIVAGHDSNYSNTVYSRKIYSVSDILENRYFSDIMTPLDDGRIQIDYTKFHTLKSPTA